MQKKISFWLIIQLNFSCISRHRANKQEGSFHFISFSWIGSGLCGGAVIQCQDIGRKGQIVSLSHLTTRFHHHPNLGASLLCHTEGHRNLFARMWHPQSPCYLPEIIFSIWWLMFENASVEGLPHGFWLNSSYHANRLNREKAIQRQPFSYGVS